MTIGLIGGTGPEGKGLALRFALADEEVLIGSRDESRAAVARAAPVPEGSAALQAKAVLPDSIIAAAFQTISARDLMDTDHPVDSDVVVCGQSREARETVMALAEKVPGVRAVDGGGLSNAGYVENLTPLLVNINRRYKAHSAIKIVGI